SDRLKSRSEPADLAGIPEFDTYEPAVMRDRAAAYRRLHAGPRVHRWRNRAVWILGRHDDVRTALRAKDALSSADGVTLFESPLPMMLTMDRPEHTRL